jgi:hypothetical protein
VPQRVGYTWHTLRQWVPDAASPAGEATEIWIATAEHLKLGILATAPRPHLADADGQELAWPA